MKLKNKKYVRNRLKKKYGPRAIIAGAAEGIGKAYAKELAINGLDLLLVDRKELLLNELKNKLEQEYSISCIALHLDLEAENADKEIMLEVKKLDCGLLIYNAAISRVKPFLKHNRHELDEYVAINTATQLKLVHAFALYLKERKSGGGIVLMSSLAGLIGMQLVATYAATKAFAWNLAEALHFELSVHKIDILACIAGATATPAYLNTNPKYGFIRPTVMKPDKLANLALRQIGKRVLYVPGFANRINYFLLTRLMPRKLASRIANKTMLNMYKHHL